MGFGNSEDPLSEFRYYMTNWIRKVRLGVDIFDKKILDSCKFKMCALIKTSVVANLETFHAALVMRI